MSAAQIVMSKPVGAAAGNGGAAAPASASAPGRWLDLAAAPTFAAMALWTVVSSARPDMPGMVMHAASAMSATSGMTLMYLLMSVLHSSAWLKLIASRRGRRQVP